MAHWVTIDGNHVLLDARGRSLNDPSLAKGNEKIAAGKDGGNSEDLLPAASAPGGIKFSFRLPRREKIEDDSKNAISKPKPQGGLSSSFSGVTPSVSKASSSALPKEKPEKKPSQPMKVGKISLQKPKEPKKPKPSKNLSPQLPKQRHEKEQALRKILSESFQIEQKKKTPTQPPKKSLPKTTSKPKWKPMGSGKKPTKGVFVQAHEVKIAGSPTESYHTSVRIVPRNQARYRNDPRFKNVDENGNVYATIGADSAGFGIPGRVFSDANRQKDVSSDAWQKGQYEAVPIPSNHQDEDAFIEKLFELDRNFKDGRLGYDTFPSQVNVMNPLISDYLKNPSLIKKQAWPHFKSQFTDDYNSNSYTSGLLKASGLKFQDIPKPLHPTPGWEKFVPKEYFQKKTP